MARLLLLAAVGLGAARAPAQPPPAPPWPFAEGLTALPFAPVGMYTRGDLNLREHRYGINAAIRQHGLPAQGDNSTAGVEAWLRRCDTVGASVFLDLHFAVSALWAEAEAANSSSCCEAGWEGLRWSVARAATHPSVVGYYLADEPDHRSTALRHAVVVRAAEVVREADAAATGRASRPLVVCLDTDAPYFGKHQPTQVPHWRSYLDVADAILTDIYPVAGAVADGYLWPDLSDAIARAFRSLRSNTSRPLMLVMQAFGSSQTWARSPSVQELRLMAYSSLIEGGQGLFFFHMEDPATSAGLPSLPIPPHGGVNERQRSPNSPNSWNELRRLALEVGEMTTGLLSTVPPLQVSSSSGTIKARCMVEETAGRMDPSAASLLLVVLNTQRAPQAFTVSVRLPAAWNVTGPAGLIFEDREVEARHLDGSVVLADLIDGFGTRVYRLPYTAPGTPADADRPRVFEHNVIENPSFERAIGGGFVPDGLNALVGTDVDAVMMQDSRDSVDGLHSLRLSSPSDPDGLFVTVYGGGGGTEAATWFHPGTSWTLSVWARAPNTAPNAAAPRLRLGVDAYKELPWEAASWAGCAEQPPERACIEPVLTPDWRQYTLSLTTPTPKFQYMNPWIYFQQRGAGVIFMDLLQLVNNSAVPSDRLKVDDTAPATPAENFTVRLQSAQSTRPCAVVQIDNSTVPPRTTWFRLRGVSPGWMFPEVCSRSFSCGGKGVATQWFVRTHSQRTDQEHAFYGTDPTYLYEHLRTVNSFVVEAWSDRNDLGDGAQAQLLAVSAPMTFTFDDGGFAKSLDLGEFTARSLGPGEVMISAHPVDNDALKQAELITWSGFEVSGTTTAGNVTRPKFTFSEGLLFDNFTPRQYPMASDRFIHINASFSQPGVYFIGMFAVWNGVYGYTIPAPENGVNAGQFPRVVDNATGNNIMQPLAVVVPYENGSSPALPQGFIGPVHSTPAIPGDQRLALDTHAITVFDGASVWIRVVHNSVCGSACVGPELAPQVIELEIPQGMRILPWMFGAAERVASGFANVTDISKLPGGGPIPAGYCRIRLEKGATWQWGVYNKPKLQFEVPSRMIGQSFPLARIRGYSSSAGQQRADNWQRLELTVAELKPVPAPPKRLHTAYCWSNAGMVAPKTWKALGFNSIPNSNRSYGIANGMRSGFHTSPFLEPSKVASCTGAECAAPGSLIALKMKPSAADQTNGTLVTSWSSFNLSARGLNASETAEEQVKWRSALEFYNRTGLLDLSYDGFFFRNDLDAIERSVDGAQSDYVTFDVESLPDFNSWMDVGYTSENFEGRRLDGESDSAASFRIAQGWMGGVVNAAQSAKADIKPYMFNILAGFDRGIDSTTWDMAASIGFADSPAFGGYMTQNDLRLLAMSTRREREMVKPGTEVIPWLTNGESAGTGGAQTSQPRLAMFNMLLQIFANGAVGFNVYTDYGNYDGAIWLAYRDAIALVAPYEDLLCDGMPAPADRLHVPPPASQYTGAVVSAMQDASSNALLIASSATPYSTPTSWSVSSPHANSSWKLCDLATNVSRRASEAGSAAWDSPAEHGSLLLFGPETPCHGRPSARPLVKSDDDVRSALKLGGMTNAATRVSPRSVPLEGGAVTACLDSGSNAPSSTVAKPLTLSSGATCGLSHGDGDGSDVLYHNANVPYAANFSASRVVNATCAVCQLPPVIVAGAVHLALGVPDPATGKTAWSAGTRIGFFDRVEVAFGLRPYIAEASGSLLLAPHWSMAASKSFAVELQLPFARPSARVHRWTALNSSQVEHVLAFSLDGLPATVNQDCRIIVRFDGGPTIERLKRLQRAPPLPASSAVLPVQVDHSRRSLRVDGRTWRGVGFYMAGFGQGGYWWGYEDLGDLAVRGFAPHGVNQGMLYNFQYFPVDVQLSFLDRAAAVGFKVMLEVSQGWIKRNNQNLDRVSMAAQLDALAANISGVKEHPAILGYYICDDCCSSGGNGASPNSYMAQIYNVVKDADPYHAVIGAVNCGNISNLSDATIPFGLQPHTQLSLDYMMIENYRLSLANHMGAGAPGQQQPFVGEPIARDGTLRDGIPFEVLVNSPNSFEPSTNANGRLYSSCWLSTIMAGCTDQLAFVVGAQALLWSTLTQISDFASHVHELGPSLHRQFGSAPHPEAAILHTIPSQGEATYGPLRIRAWREFPAHGEGQQPLGDCAHVVVVNSLTNTSVRFAAAVKGLQAPADSETSCDCSQQPLCCAKRLFVPGPSLQISANGTLAEDVIGPGETLHYRIGCYMRPANPANLVRNPSFEETGGDVTSAHPSPAVSDDIFIGKKEWEVPRMVDGHDYRAALTADTTVAHSGRHSLKVVVPTSTPLVFALSGENSMCGAPSGRSTELSVRLKQGSAYNVTMHVQASPAGTKLALMRGSWGTGCSYPNVLPPPSGGCPYNGSVVAEVAAGQNWSEFSTTVKVVDEACTALQLRASPQHPKFGATVWIDDVSVVPIPSSSIVNGNGWHAAYFDDGLEAAAMP